MRLHGPSHETTTLDSCGTIDGRARGADHRGAHDIAAEPGPRRRAARSGGTSAIARDLVRQIGRQKFDMWFGNTQLATVGAGLEVRTDSAFAARWIESRFMNELQQAARHALGESAAVLVTVANDGCAAEGAASVHSSGRSSADVPTAEPPPPSRQDRRVGGSARRISLRRLDDFVVGMSNRLAHAAVSRMAAGKDDGCASPLFIHGECGVGKTHLLQGLCAMFIDRSGRPGLVRYVTGEQFTNEYIAAVRAGNLERFRERIRRLDLLAIDDVHFLSNKTRTQKELLHTLDEIALNGARVAMVSDNHPQHLASFDRGLVSRLLSGLVVQIDQPDRVMRVELIRRLAAARGLLVSDQAIGAIADRCVGSVRELEGGLTRLAALQGLLGTAGEPIGLTLAHQAFHEAAARPGHVVRLPAVIDTVCQRLGVTRADVMGSGRHQRVVLARSLIVYLARELTAHSFPEIAQMLGRANHSTVHTADQRLRQQLEANTLCMPPGDTPLPLRELAEQLKRAVLRAQ